MFKSLHYYVICNQIICIFPNYIKMLESNIFPFCPQDQVFILLTILGQKALSGAYGSTMVASILGMLVMLLSPIATAQQEGDAGYYANSTG